MKSAVTSGMPRNIRKPLWEGVWGLIGDFLKHPGVDSKTLGAAWKHKEEEMFQDIRAYSNVATETAFQIIYHRVSSERSPYLYARIFPPRAARPSVALTYMDLIPTSSDNLFAVNLDLDPLASFSDAS